MKTRNTFEKKDWDKAAKAFAKQAYGKKKLEAIKQERRFDIRKVEWDGAAAYRGKFKWL